MLPFLYPEFTVQLFHLVDQLLLLLSPYEPFFLDFYLPLSFFSKPKGPKLFSFSSQGKCLR